MGTQVLSARQRELLPETDEDMLEELLDPPLELEDWSSEDLMHLTGAAVACDFVWKTASAVLIAKYKAMGLSRPDGWFSPYMCRMQYARVESDLVSPEDLANLPRNDIAAKLFAILRERAIEEDEAFILLVAYRASHHKEMSDPAAYENLTDEALVEMVAREGDESRQSATVRPKVQPAASLNQLTVLKDAKRRLEQERNRQQLLSIRDNPLPVPVRVSVPQVVAIEKSPCAVVVPAEVVEVPSAVSPEAPASCILEPERAVGEALLPVEVERAVTEPVVEETPVNETVALKPPVGVEETIDGEAMELGATSEGLVERTVQEPVAEEEVEEEVEEETPVMEKSLQEQMSISVQKEETVPSDMPDVEPLPALEDPSPDLDEEEEAERRRMRLHGLQESIPLADQTDPDKSFACSEDSDFSQNSVLLDELNNVPPLDYDEIDVLPRKSEPFAFTDDDENVDGVKASRFGRKKRESNSSSDDNHLPVLLAATPRTYARSYDDAALGVPPLGGDGVVGSRAPSPSASNASSTSYPAEVRRPRAKKRKAERKSSPKTAPSLPSEPRPRSPAGQSIMSSTLSEKERARVKKSLLLLHEDISSHRCAHQFTQAVKASGAPSYNQLVRCPLDLAKIKRRIDSGEIRSVEDYEKEIYHMFLNAVMFNPWRAVTFDRTQEMRADVQEAIRLHRQCTTEQHNVDKATTVVRTRRSSEALLRKRLSSMAVADAKMRAMLRGKRGSCSGVAALVSAKKSSTKPASIRKRAIERLAKKYPKPSKLKKKHSEVHHSHRHQHHSRKKDALVQSALKNDSSKKLLRKYKVKERLEQESEQKADAEKRSLRSHTSPRSTIETPREKTPAVESKKEPKKSTSHGHKHKKHKKDREKKKPAAKAGEEKPNTEKQEKKSSPKKAVEQTLRVRTAAEKKSMPPHLRLETGKPVSEASPVKHAPLKRKLEDDGDRENSGKKPKVDTSLVMKAVKRAPKSDASKVPSAGKSENSSARKKSTQKESRKRELSPKSSGEMSPAVAKRRRVEELPSGSSTKVEKLSSSKDSSKEKSVPSKETSSLKEKDTPAKPVTPSSKEKHSSKKRISSKERRSSSKDKKESKHKKKKRSSSKKKDPSKEEGKHSSKDQDSGKEEHKENGPPSKESASAKEKASSSKKKSSSSKDKSSSKEKSSKEKSSKEKSSKEKSNSKDKSSKEKTMSSKENAEKPAPSEDKDEKMSSSKEKGEKLASSKEKGEKASSSKEKEKTSFKEKDGKKSSSKKKGEKASSSKEKGEKESSSKNKDEKSLSAKEGKTSLKEKEGKSSSKEKEEKLSKEKAAKDEVQASIEKTSTPKEKNRQSSSKDKTATTKEKASSTKEKSSSKDKASTSRERQPSSSSKEKLSPKDLLLKEKMPPPKDKPSTPKERLLVLKEKPSPKDKLRRQH